MNYMQKMNIWFISPHEHPDGQTSRTFNFARELVCRGHKVSIFCSSFTHRTHKESLAPKENFRISDVDGIRIILIRTFHYKGNGWDRGINMLSFASRTYKVGRMLPDKPDVTVGDSVPPLAAFTALQLAKKKKAAFVYQIRDIWPLALVHNGAISRWNPVYFLFRLIEKHLYRKSQCICSTLPFLHNHVLKSGGDPNKISWVPNGVNLDLYPPQERVIHSNHTLHPNAVTEIQHEKKAALIAMYIGGYGIGHDVITIVRAAKILQTKNNKRFNFEIIGEGVKRPECEKMARLCNIKNIRFLDSVPKSEVPNLQKKADVLIAPLIDSEIYRFGLNLNKLYDYFASGKPIIFAGRAPNDYVAESGAGFSIPPENPDAMVEALEKFQMMSPEDRIEMGKRARRYAEENFDVLKIVDRMESLLSQASGKSEYE